MHKILSSLERGIVKLRRKRLAREIFRRYQGTIQRGELAGMRMTGDANVSQAAHGLKIFGLYETPVMDVLAGWSPMEALLNIGAGDGYYSVGMVVAGLAQRSVCFEATEKGRAAIAANARLNGVEDRIAIHGLADAESLGKVLKQFDLGDMSGVVALCDIEGAEFSLFNDRVLELLEGARLIVELHDTLQKPLNPALRPELQARVARHFATTVISDGARQWEGIAELEAMHDIDQPLVTSEGRKVLGEWLLAAPRAEQLPRQRHAA